MVMEWLIMTMDFVVFHLQNRDPLQLFGYADAVDKGAGFISRTGTCCSYSESCPLYLKQDVIHVQFN
jgi:hypothetical protein